MQYKFGRGFLIRAIKRSKPSRHAKLSAELIKTGDHRNAMEYREKRMVRMMVAVNLHKDKDYELLPVMVLDWSGVDPGSNPLHPASKLFNSKSSLELQYIYILKIERLSIGMVL